MGKWFLIKDSEHIGPFTDEAIISMYESGMLSLNSVVWSEEYGRCDKLTTFIALKDTLPNTPPPVEQKYKKEVIVPTKHCPYCNRSIVDEDNICAMCSFELMAKAEKQNASREYKNNPQRTVAKPEKRRSSNYVVAAVVIAAILFLVVISLSSTSEPEEPPLPHPISGVMSTNYSSTSAAAPFEMISKSSDNNFYIKVYHYGTERLAATVFLRGGERIEFDVPLGSYELRWATGKDWYGQTKHFGPKTNYYKANDLFRFTETYGWTVELYLTTGGNLERVPIDDENF